MQTPEILASNRPFAMELRPLPCLCASGKDALVVLLTECHDGQVVLYIVLMNKDSRH